MKLKIQSPSEKETQDSILAWLAYQPGILAFQVNTQGTYDVHRKAFRKAGRWVIKGTPDILACLSIQPIAGPPLPLFVSFEVKSFTGRQSPEQKEFEQRLNAVNGFYYVVRSIEDTQKAIIEIKTKTLLAK